MSCVQAVAVQQAREVAEAQAAAAQAAADKQAAAAAAAAAAEQATLKAKATLILTQLQPPVGPDTRTHTQEGMLPRLSVLPVKHVQKHTTGSVWGACCA